MKLVIIGCAALLSAVCAWHFSIAADLQYELVSYSSNNKEANTSFFDFGILNQPTFTINYQSFDSAAQLLFNLFIGISIAVAVVVFMISAFQEIIDGRTLGSADGFQIKRGKEGMTNAIIGLIIVLSSWLIINTINPDLLRLPLLVGLDKVSQSPSTGSEQSTPLNTQSF